MPPKKMTAEHKQALADGININITLMFSMAHYLAVAETYLRGLEARAKAGHPIDHVASVASFFVSRVDTMLDPKLEQAGAAMEDCEYRSKAIPDGVQAKRWTVFAAILSGP